jgi:glycosyltransferase involved in cell wall biosynthesis
MKKKVLLVTEYINPPYDEGIKKTVFNLYLILNKRYNVKVVCRYGFVKGNINIINSNALFVSASIKNIIKDFKPDVLIYLPFCSGTLASYIRFKILCYYAHKAKKIFISLQPKQLKSWQKWIVQFIKPEFALTPSPELKEFWDSINTKNQLFPLVVDLSKFKPLADIERKAELRRKYNLPVSPYIISHMGHLNNGRNLETLIPLQNAGYQVIIIGSSSTPEDALGPESIKRKLTDSGIIIIEKYLENIEEIFQLSDLYVFPVIEKCGSIGLPLSILEARACGLPVLITDFGSVREFLNNDQGGIFYSTPDLFLHAMREIRCSNADYKITSVGKWKEKYNEIMLSAID